MAKKVSNPALERTARLLDLVPYLATHQGISVGELSREFSITTSEVIEDLTTLWMCGLPGYTALELMDLSFESGFVTISNAETLARPRMLDRNEVLALILGLETMLENESPQRNALSTQITSLIEKLTKFLDVARLIQAGTSISSITRGEIESSIVSRTPIQIEYHSLARDIVSTRVIHPLEFNSPNEHEYVYAYCELSMGYRTFRLDRILSTLEVDNIEPNPHPEIFPVDPVMNTITVIIGSRARDVAERFNTPSENLIMDGSGAVTLESFTPDWAIREIMSFGGEVSLRAPESLRNSLYLRSLRALNSYI